MSACRVPHPSTCMWHCCYQGCLVFWRQLKRKKYAQRRDEQCVMAALQRARAQRRARDTGGDVSARPGVALIMHFIISNRAMRRLPCCEHSCACPLTLACFVSCAASINHSMGHSASRPPLCEAQLQATTCVLRCALITYLGSAGRVPGQRRVHSAEVLYFLRVAWPGGDAGPPREPLCLALCTVFVPAAQQADGSGLQVANLSVSLCQRAFAVEQLSEALVTAAPRLATGQPRLLFGVQTHVCSARG